MASNCRNFSTKPKTAAGRDEEGVGPPKKNGQDGNKPGLKCSCRLFGQQAKMKRPARPGNPKKSDSAISWLLFAYCAYAMCNARRGWGRETRHSTIAALGRSPWRLYDCQGRLAGWPLIRQPWQPWPRRGNNILWPGGNFGWKVEVGVEVATRTVVILQLMV